MPRLTCPLFQESHKLHWRLLPLHAASVFNAPPSTLSALHGAFAQAASCRDETGRLPVHLAVRNGADPGAVAVLMDAYPKGAQMRDKKGRTPVDIARESAAGAHRERYLDILEPYRIAATPAGAPASPRAVVPPSDAAPASAGETVPPPDEASVEPSVVRYDPDEEPEAEQATFCGVEILPPTVDLHDDFRLDKWEDGSAVDRAVVREPDLPRGVTESDQQLSIRVREIGSVENMTLVSRKVGLASSSWFSIP